MRVFLLVSFLFVCSFVNAQTDYCKQIRKEIVDSTTYNYYSPYDTIKIPDVKITRSYNVDPDLAFDNMIITFYNISDLQAFFVKNPTGEGENDDKKFVIEFDDKSKFVQDSVVLSYETKNEEQIVVKSFSLSLEGGALDKLSTKQISVYSFGGISKTVSADTALAYKNYIQCIKNVRK